MKDLSSEIGKTLRRRKKTLAIAESCTGGYISHLITSVAGSSDYFIGSVISYSNEVKKNTLGVKQITLKKYGAVSAACVSEMAASIRKKFKSDFAIATSGIAGPGGGTKEKPVGTVYIAIASAKEIYAGRFSFKGNRKRIIEQSAYKALEMLTASLNS
jgi:nicotinamide-nucleotide amidase